MRHSVKDFRGIGFDADDLENSPEVGIYAYPLNWNPKRGLVHWHGKFVGKNRQGLLAFSYEEGRVRGGASGGIVVDTKTKKIVGILNGIGEGTDDRIALDVVQGAFGNFVNVASPTCKLPSFRRPFCFSSCHRILVYLVDVWPRAEALSQRLVEPPEVVKLRRTAQHLADSMRNFTATEAYAWGRDNREPEVTDAYETLIVDGGQRWRHQGNKKFYSRIPFPPLDAFIVPGSEWSTLPRTVVGMELNLKIHQAPDAVVGGRTVHVFQYAATLRTERARSILSRSSSSSGGNSMTATVKSGWTSRGSSCGFRKP